MIPVGVQSDHLEGPAHSAERQYNPRARVVTILLA